MKRKTSHLDGCAIGQHITRDIQALCVVGIGVNLDDSGIGGCKSDRRKESSENDLGEHG